MEITLTKQQCVELNHPYQLLTGEAKKVGNWEKDDEPFLGCGALWFELPKSCKNLAENLGFEFDSSDRKVFKLMFTTNGRLPQLEKAMQEGLRKMKSMYPSDEADKIIIKEYLL